MTSKGFFLSWGMLIIGVILNVFGAYVVKMKMNELGSVEFNSLGNVANYFLTLAKSPLALLGGVVIMVAPVPYAIALSRMELSVAYPVSVALNCLLILSVTILFLGESVTFNKMLGIGLILVSLCLLYK